MVSWAGQLTPNTNSRTQSQFGVVAVGDSLCECRYGGARWFLYGFSAGQQANGGSTLRLEGRVYMTR